MCAVLRRFCAQSWTGRIEVPDEFQALFGAKEAGILQVRLMRIIRHKIHRCSIILTWHKAKYVVMSRY